ncbi:hypothetical protein B0T10DRAFT_498361 [Thelonectria olida]|uniref:Uncharacterized protein n=1 Tax=Thelonectria olida TaxID=1576542 RepID=A0A9P9AJK1_9HYPO|nr:hypothetical protein B0T10DRAFT_498361 [Thelonectria olida]
MRISRKAMEAVAHLPYDGCDKHRDDAAWRNRGRRETELELEMTGTGALRKDECFSFLFFVLLSFPPARTSVAHVSMSRWPRRLLCRPAYRVLPKITTVCIVSDWPTPVSSSLNSAKACLGIRSQRGGSIDPFSIVREMVPPITPALRRGGLDWTDPGLGWAGLRTGGRAAVLCCVIQVGRGGSRGSKRWKSIFAFL